MFEKMRSPYKNFRSRLEVRKIEKENQRRVSAIRNAADEAFFQLWTDWDEGELKEAIISLEPEGLSRELFMEEVGKKTVELCRTCAHQEIEYDHTISQLSTLAHIPHGYENPTVLQLAFVMLKAVQKPHLTE